MKYEKILGYCRAFADGDMIYVSGTLGLDYATHTLAPGAAAQAERCIAIIAEALGKLGASLADVLRIVIYVPDRADIDVVSETLGRHFRGIDPVSTLVCAPLSMLEARVEIEVTARRGSAG
jgi:enamine deaminase RidA (YjgF/YER057c/UK114 family)